VADKTTNRDADSRVSAEKKLEDLYGLIEGIETAMLTTRRKDGHLVSRAMQTQKREAGADVWFVTDIGSHKLDELEFDPHVNVSYYKDRTREWVSISGTAVITQDREIIHELYEPDWKAWFGDEGGARDGGPDDPRLALVLIEAHSVTYLKKDRPQPLVLFEIAKGMITGTPPKIGDLRHVSERELR
jgi:general stress protein 26